ncbi:hypothetical protein COV61_03500 [Candidatus Micrarchaeota archaeon CG11_big_fil_rev_8_21_14_0_20_47_5]|nr:MAG: hypothetical protein COV61_03500 [Candidatus Micrarchaeota archaeon CG11_big_fil_rev_8_21_14_0_20_47_5]
MEFSCITLLYANELFSAIYPPGIRGLNSLSFGKRREYSVKVNMPAPKITIKKAISPIPMGLYATFTINE